MVRHTALWFLVALSAVAQPRPGFDCSKAASPVDRLICSDESLANLDRALAEQYDELRKHLTPQGLVALRTGQRNWLGTRRDCMANTISGGPRSRTDAIACLASADTDRTEMLNTQYRSAGSLSIENREIARHIAKLRVSELDSYPWLVVKPEAKADAFNRYITQRLGLAKGLFAASGMKLDPRPDGDTDFSRHYEVHHFDERLISIEIFTFHESYIGHGWRAEFAINWDVQRAKPIGVAELFRSDQDWQRVVYDFAMKQIREQGEIKDPESWFTVAEVDGADA